jgi:diaminopimelate epimerase
MVFAKKLELPKTATHIAVNGQTVCCKPVSNHENMHFVNVQMLEPIAIKKLFKNFVMTCGAQFCMVPTDDVYNVNVVERGREIAYSKRFPKGANVTFYQPHHGFLEIRHYEHQIDQETYTNGLCVIGAALSHAQNNPGNRSLVRTGGSEMLVSFARSKESFYNIELQLLINTIYHGKTI